MADEAMLEALYPRSTERTLANYLRFEQYVLSVLTAYAEDRGMEFIPHPRPSTNEDSTGGVMLDGIFPQGFESLPGPTLVEVRGGESGPSLDRKLRRITSRLRIGEVKSILLVTQNDLDASDVRVLTKRTNDRGFVLEVWDASRLREVAQVYSDRLSQDSVQLTLAPLRRALDEPPDDWSDSARAHLQNLSEIYSSDGVSLFLGAGTSAGAGLPSWEDLVGALFLTVFVQQLSQNVEKDSATLLMEVARELNGNSPLLLARYLRRGFSESSANDESAFQTAVADTLYKDVEEGRTSDLLEAIAKLCMPLRTGWKIHSVVTYNFDDLLESLLEDQGSAYRSIYYSERLANESELPIYHVHGYLPRTRSGFERLDNSIFAFSEEGYHELFRDPYHWTNIVQLNLLRERTCLFLGLSFSDPNLRRLLEIAARGSDHPRHFAFMRRTSLADLKNRSTFNSSISESTVKAFLATHHALQERVLAELGVQVIWFEDFAEMPRALLSLIPSRKGRRTGDSPRANVNVGPGKPRR